jgi:ribosomal protein S27AE
MMDDYRLQTDRETTVRITCPDCGPVTVVADVWEGGKPCSGECPECGDRLYFGA